MYANKDVEGIDMADYEYRCSWCLNKATLTVDHMIGLVCPVCERRTLRRLYPEVNDEAREVFRRFLKENVERRHRG